MFFSQCIQVMVSMNRVQKFLDLREVPTECLISENIEEGEIAIKIDGHSFTWGVKQDKDSKYDSKGKKGKKKTSPPKEEETKEAGDKRILDEDSSDSSSIKLD